MYYRSIYYQNPELFGSQSYVDRLVDDIAYTFGVGRNELNVVSLGTFSKRKKELTSISGCCLQRSGGRTTIHCRER